MSEGPKARRHWFQFSLGGMLWLVAIAAGISWIATQVNDARYAAKKSALGNQRFSRWQAEIINSGRPVALPDSEFRETDNPHDAYPQRGQLWP